MKTFDVHVCRIGYAHRTFQIEADNEKEAKEKALDEAGNYEYSENSSDYEIESCTEQ